MLLIHKYKLMKVAYRQRPRRLEGEGRIGHERQYYVMLQALATSTKDY